MIPIIILFSVFLYFGIIIKGVLNSNTNELIAVEKTSIRLACVCNAMLNATKYFTWQYKAQFNDSIIFMQINGDVYTPTDDMAVNINFRLLHTNNTVSVIEIYDLELQHRGLYECDVKIGITTCFRGGWNLFIIGHPRLHSPNAIIHRRSAEILCNLKCNIDATSNISLILKSEKLDSEGFANRMPNITVALKYWADTRKQFEIFHCFAYVNGQYITHVSMATIIETYPEAAVLNAEHFVIFRGGSINLTCANNRIDNTTFTFVWMFTQNGSAKKFCIQEDGTPFVWRTANQLNVLPQMYSSNVSMVELYNLSSNHQGTYQCEIEGKTEQHHRRWNVIILGIPLLIAPGIIYPSENILVYCTMEYVRYFNNHNVSLVLTSNSGDYNLSWESKAQTINTTLLYAVRLYKTEETFSCYVRVNGEDLPHHVQKSLVTILMASRPEEFPLTKLIAAITGGVAFGAIFGALFTLLCKKLRQVNQPSRQQEPVGHQYADAYHETELTDTPIYNDIDNNDRLETNEAPPCEGSAGTTVTLTTTSGNCTGSSELVANTGQYQSLNL